MEEKMEEEGVAESTATGGLEATGRPTAPETMDDRSPADVRYLAASRFGPEAHVPLHFAPLLH